MTVPDEYEGLLVWLQEHLDIDAPQLLRTLSGGNSNTTLLLHCDKGNLIVRHPPARAISELASSGIEREARVLNALTHYNTKLPGFKGFCNDSKIIGAPFLVSEFIEGISITDTLPKSYAATPETLHRIGSELVESIARVHTIDWRELDLPGFRESSAFLSRQIERWQAIRDKDKVRDLPLIKELAMQLQAQIPSVSHSSLIHGDYHLDNTLFLSRSVKLGAIIDWELATIGDPRLDIALLLAFWGPREVEQPALPFVQAITRFYPAPSRSKLAALWSEITEIPFENYRYFCGFAFWRLAVIIEGAYVLYRQGKITSEYARNLEYDVPRLLEEAYLYLNKSN